MVLESRIATINVASLPSFPTLLPEGEGCVMLPAWRGVSRIEA